MENNVSPNNIPSEDGQFKHENRLSMISGVILFINILGSIALLITGIVELNSYRSNGYGWIYIFHLLRCCCLHFTSLVFIVVKEISINIKRSNKKQIVYNIDKALKTQCLFILPKTLGHILYYYNILLEKVFIFLFPLIHCFQNLYP